MPRPTTTMSFRPHPMIHQTYYALVHRFRTTASGLIDAHPQVETPLYRVRDGCARLLVETTRMRNRVVHSAPPNPYRLYRVDPTDITDSISWQELSTDRGTDIPEPFTLPNYHFAGRVLGGDWDADRQRFAESVVYRSFRAHFDNGVPWRETDLYEQCLTVIDDGGSPWGCRSRADVDRRCRGIERLYERIASEGYKTQSELHASGTYEPFDHARPNKYTRMIDGEIALAVGRDGELLFYDGRNRLAVAKLLDIDAVPVVILVRHERWQRLRDAIADGRQSLDSLSKSLRAHPDLVGLPPTA